jgi:predicted amidohydrolase YtcJ
MTLAGAYAGFEENQKGSIEVGKLADLTVLSQDLMTVEADRILDTVVSWTMVNGEVVYSNNAEKVPQAGHTQSQ